jgi:hypothetical protein
MEEIEKRMHGSSIGSLIFVGCMFIGGGIGMIFHAVEIGGAIGMGVGFIAMGITWALFRQK